MTLEQIIKCLESTTGHTTVVNHEELLTYLKELKQFMDAMDAEEESRCLKSETK